MFPFPVLGRLINNGHPMNFYYEEHVCMHECFKIHKRINSIWVHTAEMSKVRIYIYMEWMDGFGSLS